MLTRGNFHLVTYLAADLRRARTVNGQVGDKAGLGLAAGLFSPRFAPVLLCRVAYWFDIHHIGILSKVISLINYVIFGIEISPKCSIGKGLYFPHTQGTVIGANSIGENATIYHNVTLGAREIDINYIGSSRPVVGDEVLIGSGAKVLGGVSIGDGVRIGANAVVVRSVPDGALVRAPLGEIVPPSDAV
jgi:serine O-acetyltransferase